MEPEQRQRIIGYFLEETQEYLELLEPGMDDLESALADEERINELYRAAHSIKGGAAMLELDGIQKVAYRLESSLKFMKANPVSTSREIEAKLLKGVLGIKRLMGEVRESMDNMTDASAAEVWGDVEPTFDSLDQELQAQVANASSESETTNNEAAITEAGASEAAAQLPDLSLDESEADATNNGLDELSWDDIDDLTNLGNDSAPSPTPTPASETRSGIDGLDALANLFDETPLEAEDSLAWDQEISPASGANAPAVGIDDFTLDDLDGLEESLDNGTPSDAGVLENLLADPLLGDDLSQEANGGSTPLTDTDFDDLFGDANDELALNFEEPVLTSQASEGIATAKSDESSSDLDELDAELDALGLESMELTTDPPTMDASGDFSTALDAELTEADTWVAEDKPAEQQITLETLENSSDAPFQSEIDNIDLEDLSELDLGELGLTEPAISEEPPTSSEEGLPDDGNLVDIVDFAAELDAELESDLAGDLDIGNEAIGTASELESDADDLLNSLDASADGADISELDEFLDSTSAHDSQNSALGNLDSLLDEMASTETPSIDGNNDSGVIADDFDDLDSLLGAPSPQLQPEASPKSAKLDDFADMEKLLQGTESLAGPASSTTRSKTAAAPPAKTRSRSQRLREQSMRVPIKTLDNFNNLVGEMVVNRNSLEGDQDRLKQSLEKLVDHTQKLSDVGQKLQDLYERSLLENALLNSRRKVMGMETMAVGSSGLNLSASNPDNESAVGDLDDLELDKFTGFHTLSQDIIELIVRVRESASDIDFLINESLDQDTRNFRQTTSQLQEEVNRSRMVPFAQTADRLPRAVRDIAHKCGKSARLTIEGRDTLIDKMLIEQLHDPLTHLINNAVTHGIETQEERIMNGKSADGAIRLQAFYQGNQTVISVSDDGAGIDPEQIKQKAIEKGLVRSEDAEQLGVSQLYDFLFHAGFSTRSKADAFAGRGVGMDVVRTRLQELRGTVVIDSDIGKGTTFTIRLPLTLSITKALQCISNRARIAFPLDGVEDMFDIPKEQIVTDAEGNQTIQWRDMMLPVRELSELLKYNRTIGRSSVYAGTADDDMAALVILRSAGEYLAVNVDRAEGEMDIVIKQLEGPVPKPTGIAGATVLSDGQVMPIADVLELIDISKGRTRQGAAALWEEEQEASDEDSTTVAPSEPMVLIVDDSITVRELLSMSFAKAGYRVEQARDGQEAWEKLRSGLPCDLIFCDIEMPRMTGLELLEKLQEDAELKQLPMSMLTSRGADKHRQLAAKLGAKGYFTKPYLEEALLEAANKLLKGEILLQLE